MKELTLEIKPKVGLGELNFGDSSEKLISILGEAEELDDIEDEDEFNTVILKYKDKGIYVFFEGVEKSVISCFELDKTPEATLYGKKVFDLKEEVVVELMEANGFGNPEYETEENTEAKFPEKRLSFEDAMIDFFFEQGEMKAINWGVLVNDQGEIEEF